jgi:hypothetical protein
MLASDHEIARQAVKRLINGKVTMTPSPGGYELRVRASYGRVIEGIIGVVSVVPPG